MNDAAPAPTPAPPFIIINDERTMTEFKNITFSKYKKNDIKKELQKSIIDGKLEDSCFLLTELICAGHFTDIWEIIFLVVGKHIHTMNPKLPVYIEAQYNKYNNTVDKEFIRIDKLQQRNSPSIRSILTEIICVLCLSNKRTSFENIKIRPHELRIENITERLTAPDTHYAQNIFRNKDPREFFVATNEFMYALLQKNTRLACYWIEWIIEFDNICHKNKSNHTCERRIHYPVQSKFHSNTIWLFWDVLFEAVKTHEHSALLKRIITSLMQLFCVDYTYACCRRRIFILYFSVALLTENIDITTEIIAKDCIGNVREMLNGGINEIYSELMGYDTNYTFDDRNSSDDDIDDYDDDDSDNDE